MNIEPIGDRILVRQEKSDDRTESGLYIPDNAQKQPNTGEVIAIPIMLETLDFTVGNTILFAKYAGTIVNSGDEELLILDVEEIIAVLHED